MKNYTFSFDTKILLEQFCEAFGNVIIKKYDNNKTLLPGLTGNPVRFVYMPKSRVYNSLATAAPGGITVPVISVVITSITRDKERVFNKLDGFTVDAGSWYPQAGGQQVVLQPVPINMSVHMTLCTKFQVDMDQIISNFVPYCDPYIIISWKIPSPTSSTVPYEIRSEVQWSGDIKLEYPEILNSAQDQLLSAETDFTIKGWMFKQMGGEIKLIYTINTSYIDENPSVILETL